MNRRVRGACVLGAFLVGVLLLAIPSRAAADPAAGDRAELPALRKAGAEAAKAKNWQACIAAYSRAAEIEADPITFGELGLCEEGAGRYSSAHPHLTRALSGMAPGAARRDKYQAALRRVAELVAIVFVSVLPTDARVLVDGRPVGIYDGRYVVVSPGPHVFAARKRGYKDAVKSLTANAGEMPSVEFALTKLPEADAAPSAVPPRAAKPAPAASASPVGPVRAAKPAGASPRIPWYMPAWSPRGVLVPLAGVATLTAVASAATAIGFEVHYSTMKASTDARGFVEATCTPGQPLAASANCQEIHARRLWRDTAVDTWIGTSIAAGAVAGIAGLAIALEPLGPRLTATANPNGGGIVVLGAW